MNASLWALVCVPAALICMCNIMGFHELSPLSLSATHPADHSNPDPSSLHVAHFAQSILRLGDVKLPCQLGHTTSCWKRGGNKAKRWVMESLTTNMRTGRMLQYSLNTRGISRSSLPPESASLSLLVNPSYVNIALWTNTHTSTGQRLRNVGDKDMTDTRVTKNGNKTQAELSDHLFDPCKSK